MDRWFHIEGFHYRSKGFRLARQREDVAGQGREIAAFELRVHPNDRTFARVIASDRPLMRDGRGVVFLGHFGAVALPKSSFCWDRRWFANTRPSSLFPILAELGQFSIRVATEVTHLFTHGIPILPLDMSTIIAVVGPRPRERDLVLRAALKEAVVDERASVAGIESDDREHRHQVLQYLEDPL